MSIFLGGNITGPLGTYGRVCILVASVDVPAAPGGGCLLLLGVLARAPICGSLPIQSGAIVELAGCQTVVGGPTIVVRLGGGLDSCSAVIISGALGIGAVGAVGGALGLGGDSVRRTLLLKSILV